MTLRPEWRFLGAPVRIPTIEQSTVAAIAALICAMIASSVMDEMSSMVFAAAFIGGSLAASGMSIRQYPMQTLLAMVILLAAAYPLCLAVERVVGAIYGV
jgi:hypothetical protein